MKINNEFKYYNRIRVVFGLFFLYIMLLAYKQINYQFFKSDNLKVMADSQYKYKEKASNLNFLLLDCNGKDLLEYEDEFHIVIDPEAFKKNYDYSQTKDLFAFIYILRNYNKEYDISKIGLSQQNVRLHFVVDKRTYDKINEIKGLKGVYSYVYKKVNRNEPWSIENIISSNKRTIDNSKKDVNSLETQIFNKLENNAYTYIEFEKSLDDEVNEGQFNIPNNNTNVRLTLDKNYQNIIRQVLQGEEYKKYKQIGVVLMEAKTGKIKALVQNNEHNPNVLLGAATENGFPPGSIFKVIIEETALDRNIISVNDRFICDERNESLCKIYHGNQSLEEAFARSCNNVFWDIAEKVKFNNFLDNAKLQGLFKKVLNLDCEVQGDWQEPGDFYGSLRQLAIGQSMRISPIQALSIVNTVINNGIYVKPYIVDAYVNNDNEPVEKVSTDSYRVISEDTANILKNHMRRVVTSEIGTGKEAYIENIITGGKTGTNQRFEYSQSGTEEHSDGWFIGYFKINGNYYSMVTFVKDIDVNNESAHNTAAPIFSHIVKELNKIQ